MRERSRRLLPPSNFFFSDSVSISDLELSLRALMIDLLVVNVLNEEEEPVATVDLERNSHLGIVISG